MTNTFRTPLAPPPRHRNNVKSFISYFVQCFLTMWSSSVNYLPYSIGVISSALIYYLMNASILISMAISIVRALMVMKVGLVFLTMYVLTLNHRKANGLLFITKSLKILILSISVRHILKNVAITLINVKMCEELGFFVMWILRICRLF